MSQTKSDGERVPESDDTVWDPVFGMRFRFAREGDILRTEISVDPDGGPLLHVHPIAEERWEVVEGDVTEAESLKHAVQGCDAVVHAAGLPSPATRRRFERVHIDGTRNITGAATAAGVRRFINIASEAVVFSGVDLLDIDESYPYPERYIDPYSRTKAEAERVALAHHDANGMGVISLRPASVWGEGDTTILKPFVKLAMSFGVPMAGDGSNLEETTHVGNLSDCVLRALDVEHATGRAYFVTDDFTVQWRQFYAAQLEAVGAPARFRRVPKLFQGGAWLLDRTAGLLGLPVPLAYFAFRMGLTSRRYITTAAREDLDYQPTIDLQSGLAELRAWSKRIGGPKQIGAASSGTNQPPSTARA
jgi:2-alkyl-3-oxoalkanoate reductase